MLDVKTPLSKVHRATRRIATGFAAAPGLWAYVTTGNVLTNIAATSTQPKVLKIVLGNASTSQYESNDVTVGSISTLEGVFRASVDTNGYQKLASDGSTDLSTLYTQGAELTVAYTTSNATGTSDVSAALAADLGKLRPVGTISTGAIVVARVENIDSTGNILTFETVTPYPKA
jgi:hypothetical protein